MMTSLFDPEFSSLTHSDMYRGWVFPELYPTERQPVLGNWSDEDQEAFCGIYTPARRKEIRAAH